MVDHLKVPDEQRPIYEKVRTLANLIETLEAEFSKTYIREEFMTKHHQQHSLYDDVTEPEEPTNPEEPTTPENGEEVAPQPPPPEQIVVKFDTDPHTGVWQAHDVWGRLSAFGGNGIEYLEGAPPA